MTTTTTTVEKKLQFFYENHKIPHLLFYGSTDCEKERIVSAFIHQIYRENRQAIKYNVLFVNCSGKGIRFIRDEIKTFAKMHIQCFAEYSIQKTSSLLNKDQSFLEPKVLKKLFSTDENQCFKTSSLLNKDQSFLEPQKPTEQQPATDFKTIILLNADYLTEDAQSALRRSIELFSHTTRFFIIAENKNKLLKPILSRFCEIYIPPTQQQQNQQQKKNEPNEWITQNLPAVSFTNPLDFILFATEVVERGLSSFDFIYSLPPNTERTLNTTFRFHQIKSEYRCEKMLITTLLYYYYYNYYGGNV